jgi:osmotically-inducible protein OsmY
MSSMCSLRLIAIAGILTAAGFGAELSGCATYDKCGFNGCAPDRQITSAVQGVIHHYPSLEGTNSVRVQTLNHVVYLYGQVDTEQESWTAQQAALSVPGVDRVVNSISLGYQGR